MPGLFLDADGKLVLVELDHAVSFGLIDVTGEDQSPVIVPRGPFDHLGKAASVEEVVAEYQGAVIITDKRFTDQKGLCYALGRGLHGIFEAQAQRAAVAEKPAVEVDVIGGRNDQDFPYVRHHEHGQRVVDHRLVENGDDLFRYGQGLRVQTPSVSTRKNDALHL